MSPLTCSWLEACPAGSESGEKYGSYIVFALFCLILFLVFKIKDYRANRAEKKRKLMLDSYVPPKPTSISADSTDVHQSISIPSSQLSVPTAWREDEFSVDGFERSVGSSQPAGLDVAFNELGFALPSGQVILSGVSGAIRSGRVCAVMGPSGAGKTTFLSVLSGKIASTSGTICVNGKRQTSGLQAFRRVVGFVPQEDIMIRSLTVYQVLSFSAAYRLDVSLSLEERRKRIFHVVHTLGLSGVLESVIGDEKVRGLSGGQRKRVNVGIELVADPRILFLDEPTSGLDSSTSLKLCNSLREIASRDNVTIAAVLHQPRYEIFNTFDDLLLLGRGGRTVYMGPCSRAIEYFSALGFQMPPLVNPADFLMDVVAGQVPRVGEEENFDASLLPEVWTVYSKTTNMYTSHLFPCFDPWQVSKPSEQVAVIVPSNVHASSSRSRFAWVSRLVGNVREAVSDARDDFVEWFHDLKEASVATMKCENSDPTNRHLPSMWKVFLLCLVRAFSQLYRTWGSFVRENMIHILMGLFLGVISANAAYLGPIPDQLARDVCPFVLSEVCQAAVSDPYTSIGLFIMMSVSFAGVSSASQTFGLEETNYWRESGAQLSSTAYFLAKLLADMPRLLVATFLFEVAYLSAFSSAANTRVLFALVMLLYWNGYGLGYVITVVFGFSSASLVGIVVTLLFSIVLSGIAFSVNTVDASVAWLFDISYSRWGMLVFYENELKVTDYFKYQRTLQQFGYDEDDASKALGILFGTGCLWIFVGYLLMVCLNRDKKK